MLDIKIKYDILVILSNSMFKRKIFYFYIVIIVLFFCLNISAKESEDLNIDFYKGMLSVNIKDVDTKAIFKALEEKGKIKILNKKIIPDKKVRIKFKGLKETEGIKELMRACGIRNYVIIPKKEVKPDESKIAKLILIKAETGKVPKREVKVPEAKKKEIEKAHREAIIKTITPILQGTDEETRKAIIKEIREGEVEEFTD